MNTVIDAPNFGLRQYIFIDRCDATAKSGRFRNDVPPKVTASRRSRSIYVGDSARSKPRLMELAYGSGTMRERIKGWRPREYLLLIAFKLVRINFSFSLWAKDQSVQWKIGCDDSDDTINYFEETVIKYDRGNANFHDIGDLSPGAIVLLIAYYFIASGERDH